MNNKVAIIGAGPGGITASIYLKRAGIDFQLFEPGLIGGKVNLTSSIDNYPPFKSIEGYALSMKYEEQLAFNDIVVTKERVICLEKEENCFKITTKQNQYYFAAVIICSGTKNKYLGIPTESKFINKGVSLCALCDGMLYKNKDVAVVGGGNSSLEESLYLSNIVSKLYLIHRRNEFRGSKEYLDKLKEKDNVIFLTPYVITSCLGEDSLESLELENVNDHSKMSINVKALFEYVGSTPNTEFVKNKEILTKDGFVEVDINMKTVIDGLYACGDVINNSLRQIIVSSSEGVRASQEVIKYLQNLYKGNDYD